jgi:hypothetical protein
VFLRTHLLLIRLAIVKLIEILRHLGRITPQCYPKLTVLAKDSIGGEIGDRGSQSKTCKAIGFSKFASLFRILRHVWLLN